MKFPLLAALLAVSLPAAAIEYTGFAAERSQVVFVSKQMNVPVEGHFKTFDGDIRFDPSKPAEGKANLQVELASIDTGLEEANQEVAGPDWFDVAKHPRARFESTSVEPLGQQRYRISGKLTIKGTTHDISTEASFEPGDASGAFSGSFKIKRSDYDIGEGIWGDTSVVADEIEIRYRIAAPAR